MGGGDGLAVREILKYPDVKRITVVDLDPVMTELATKNEIFLKVNEGSLADRKVRVINQDAYQYIKASKELYDVILVDLPDPKSVSLSLLYSLGFYKMVKKHLKPFGAMVTQSTSPLYAPEAFLCIKKTLQEAGFAVVPYQNSIPSMGRWGWNLGVKQEAMASATAKEKLLQITFDRLPTRFINHDAMISMTHFGKGLFEREPTIQPNTEFNHVLLKYYRKGDWEVY